MMMLHSRRILIFKKKRICSLLIKSKRHTNPTSFYNLNGSYILGERRLFSLFSSGSWRCQPRNNGTCGSFDSDKNHPSTPVRSRDSTNTNYERAEDSSNTNTIRSLKHSQPSFHYGVHFNMFSSKSKQSTSALQEAYQDLVKKEILRPDPIQKSCIDSLSKLSNRLEYYEPRLLEWRCEMKAYQNRIKKKEEEKDKIKKEEEKDTQPIPPKVPRGRYIVGGVGVGKSMCADFFYKHVSLECKRRVHFHEFMLEIHSRIHKWKKDQFTKEKKELFLKSDGSYDLSPGIYIKTIH